MCYTIFCSGFLLVFSGIGRSQSIDHFLLLGCVAKGHQVDEGYIKSKGFKMTEDENVWHNPQTAETLTFYSNAVEYQCVDCGNSLALERTQTGVKKTVGWQTSSAVKGEDGSEKPVVLEKGQEFVFRSNCGKVKVSSITKGDTLNVVLQ